MKNINDWYRNDKWNLEIENEFENRLNRSRGDFHKAQYLRIQASYLLKSNNKTYQNKGVELMERLIDLYPNETSSLIFANEQLGDYFYNINNYKRAENHYRIVTDFYYTNTRSNTSGIADLKLSKLILKSVQKEKYNEAYEIATSKFKESKGDLILNDNKFFHFDLLANLCFEMGKKNEAVKYAIKALELSKIVEPQFKRHKSVGIIKLKKGQLERLKKIIGKKS